MVTYVSVTTFSSNFLKNKIMRKAFNVLFFVGVISAIYFLLGVRFHFTGSTAAIYLSGLCFSSGVFLRVLEV